MQILRVTWIKANSTDTDIEQYVACGRFTRRELLANCATDTLAKSAAARHLLRQGSI